MLNKLQFNNLVISHKKEIQQARSETVNKFVQKIRKLQYHLEKKPEDRKTKERLLRTTDNLEELKKLKRVDIIKKVLLLTTNANKIITNGRASSEEIAIAMLANNKNMHKLIKQFREELQLKENDKEWRKQITEKSKRRMKIERTEEKRRKRKQMKELKVLEHNRRNWLEQNQTLDKNENNDEKCVASVVDLHLQTLNVSTLPEESTNTKTRQRSGKHKINNSLTQKICSNGQQKDVNESLENLIANNQVAHTEDPFFITATGDKYLSTAVMLPIQHTDSGENYEQSYNPNRANTPKPRQHIRQGQGHYSFIKRSHGTSSGNQKQINAVKGQPNRLDADLQESKIFKSDDQSELNANLEKKTISNCVHPSWMAKQKLKPKITAFQGTKIKFDEDD